MATEVTLSVPSNHKAFFYYGNASDGERYNTLVVYSGSVSNHWSTIVPSSGPLIVIDWQNTPATYRVRSWSMKKGATDGATWSQISMAAVVSPEPDEQHYLIDILNTENRPAQIAVIVAKRDRLRIALRPDGWPAG